MTTSPPREALSEGTLSCLTGAIVLREGARAVGSTFAQDSSAGSLEPLPPLPSSTPSSLRALPVLPTPSAVVIEVARRPRPLPRSSRSRPRARVRSPSLPWGLVGAFALGATFAALAGLGLDRGGLEVAALASAAAGGMTLAAALSRAGKRHAARRRH
jgi:hypothetical protein